MYEIVISSLYDTMKQITFNPGLEQNVGLLLFIFAYCLAYPYWIEFRDWVRRRCRVVKRCRLRREAVRTNLLLYRQTGDIYYLEKAEELGRKVKRRGRSI